MNSNNNRLVMILAAAVVVLFIAFIAVVLLNQGGNTGTNTAGTGTAGTGAVATTGTSNPGMGTSAGEFDPATATKVPSKYDPKTYVEAYYQAILDKKWETAFKMQPAASQQGGTVADFQQTQEQMYGMTSFKVASSQIGDTEATVTVNQELGQNGTWNAKWTFVKDNGTWLVKERKVGMGAAQ